MCEKINIIFLDMDGVLNSTNFLKEYFEKHSYTEKTRDEFKRKYCIDNIYFIEPSLKTRFDFICSNIENCCIVWSSSWRLGNQKYSPKELYHKCNLLGKFIGYTPKIPYMFRSDEIKNWINNNIDKYKINKIIIIDDDSDAEIQGNYLDIPCKFIKTHSTIGLTEEQAKSIIEYFKMENINV